MPLPRRFYRRPARAVARDLLGCVLASRRGSTITAGRIVETEAYLGPEDAASHAAFRPGSRARFYGEGGFAYIYLNYGIHCCLNAIAGRAGRPGCVLIRALEPTLGLATMARRRGGARDRPRPASGPGNLTRALGVTLAALARLIDGNGHAPEVRQAMKELVAHLLRHAVTLGDRQASPHAHTHVDMEPVADPPRPRVGDVLDPRDVACRVKDLVQNLGLDPVEHPEEDRARGLPDEDEDRDRDRDASERVGERIARAHAEGADEHREARPAVDAGMLAVGDQRGAPDLSPDTNPEDRDGLVASEANERREDHRPEVLDGPRLEQTRDRPEGRDEGTGEDRDDDRQPREVLRAPEAIGEATGRAASGEPEGDTEGERGRCVGEVVDGVGEERDAPRERDDDRLEERGRGEADAGPLERPEPTRSRRDRRIDDAVRVPVVRIHTPSSHSG